MFKPILMVSLCLVVAFSSACNFSFGSSPDIAKANTLTDESNALGKEGVKLKDEALDKYSKLLNDNPNFEEWPDLEPQMKELVKQLDTSQSKLKEASAKINEASRLNVPDWFKQYLALRTDLLGKESEIASLASQQVKNSYDTTIETEDEFVTKSNDIKEKMAKLRKEQDDISAKIDALSKEHADDFKK